MKETQGAMTFDRGDPVATGSLWGQGGRDWSTLRLFLLVTDETLMSLDDLADGARRKLINPLLCRLQTILVIK